MKKVLYIFIFVLLSQSVFSQERFFDIYPGWKANVAMDLGDKYLLSGSDTLDFGNSNTPIFNEIDYLGNLLNTARYINDTVYGISTYSSKSFSADSEQIIASSVYLKFTKDYILNPILLFFDKQTYSIDSIIDFSNYFDGKSARFILHFETDTAYILLGDVQYSTDANVRTFFGIYNTNTASFEYMDYDRPTHCQMTPSQILPTEDGGYLLATEQDITYVEEEVYACILKIDATGNEQWRYIIEGQTDIPPWGLQAATFRPRIFNSQDGNYYVVWTDPFFNEYINQPNTESTIRIGKLTDHGTYGEISEETDLRPSLDNFERAPYIINDSYQDEDGTMYVLMQSQNGYQSAFAKIHPNGVGAWMRVYRCYPDNDATLTTTQLYGITKTDDGGFMLTGAFYSGASTMFPSGMTASCVFKVDSCGCFEEEGCNDHCMDSYSEYYVYMQEASIYPNPAKDKITVGFEYEGSKDTEFEYSIYNIDGKQILNDKSKACDLAIGTCNLKIDLCDLPSGYYMIQLWGGGKIFTGRFVKE